MCNKNLMLNQILASAGVNFTLHITDVTDIVSLTNISTTSASKKHLHLHIITCIGLLYLKRK